MSTHPSPPALLAGRGGPGERPAGTTPPGTVLHPFRGIRRSASALSRDRTPAFYVLEQRRGGALLQRGVIGALDLDASRGAVLPHEHVLAAKVRAQHRITRLVGGNPEPVLLACRDAPAAGAVLRRVTRAAPDTVVTAPDGTRHALWRLIDPGQQRVLAADLAARSVLIADGHHRYAAAWELRRRRDGRPGPWDRLPALVVDSARTPLGLRAIHRHLPDLGAREAAARAAAVADVEELDPDARRPPRPGELILVGGDGRYSVTRPRPEPLLRALDGRPEAWRRLDAAVLHCLFVDGVWRPPSGPRPVRYLHDGDGHPHDGEGPGSTPSRGTLVLLAPPAEDDIWRLAAQGVRVPEKTTSFLPKPPPWLLTYHHGHQTREPRNARGR
ncbi:hypothetical protein EES43_07095 [Streptomyces sp. ADI96-02]|uniref:DUF1015 family protein n=1 Tax=unclassified Streptomyces TaxID=2593676 RepID=UPI000FA29EC5|nr:DUF1015 family protein [Streptomyces sp. ADI96-02]RPK65829.1 hypothetical protein EES43_07095 [Streptomyces sp. ADI96-02]